MLAGHQPCYIPGIIVFTKMALCDAFMFVGHCQFQNKSWHSRNYIRGDNGPLMLSIPVEKNFGQSIDDTKPLVTSNWKRKHLASIEHAYKGRPYFDDYFPHLKETYDKLWLSLALFNETLMQQLCRWLHIAPKFMDSFGVTGHKTDMLISMCKVAGADSYLSSPGETYVDQEQMRAAEIVHHFLKFEHPVYEQGHKKFMPNLSVIDLLFNCGPEAGKIVREAGHART